MHVHSRVQYIPTFASWWQLSCSSHPSLFYAEADDAVAAAAPLPGGMPDWQILRMRLPCCHAGARYHYINYGEDLTFFLMHE
jgi:hypothetical protein